VKRKQFLAFTTLGAAWFVARGYADAGARTIGIFNGKFLLDGQPFRFISGSMHYVRVPHEYWRDRLRMARAMGLNTVCTYVFWNMHEPRPGEYDLTGRCDVGRFVRTAQDEGLHVILRVGPYACVEWDFGGYPAWLLKDPRTVVRSRDARFMPAVRGWLARLGREIAPLQWPRGGPVLAVQVENEYGSFGDDHTYMQEIRAAIEAAGFDSAIRYTEDGIPELPAGSLPGIPVAGSIGDPRTDMPVLTKFRPGNPVMAGEYYPGWFDHWGEPHHEVPVSGPATDIAWLLDNGYSFNLYVFHGGTNFGFMNGANYSTAVPYQPTTTSYDYDAPLAEGGYPTQKYDLLRSTIVAHAGIAPPPVPAPPARIVIPEFSFAECAPLADLYGGPIASQRPRHLEAFDQAYGYIVYRTQITGPRKGALHLREMRHYAVVLVAGRRVGDIDRRLGQHSLDLEIPAGTHTLDILVENGGRINYGHQLVYERTGITQSVTLAGKQLTGWRIFTVPMNDLHTLRFRPGTSGSPAFYRGLFNVERPGDTYIDSRMFGKGSLWINAHHVGRFWSIGPQYALYVPAPWLVRGLNEAIVFDLHDRSVRRSQGFREPLYAPVTS